MTIKERWERRRRLWIAQYEKLGKSPSAWSSDPEETSAAGWQAKMRSYKSKNSSILTSNQIAMLEATPGWMWEKPDAFQTQYNLWLKVHNRTQGRKLMARSDEDEKKALQWQRMMFQISIGHMKKRSLTSEQVAILNNTPGWKWGESLFDDQLHNWIEQYNKLGCVPKTRTQNALEKRAASWQSTMRSAYRGRRYYGDLKDGQKEILENTPGWTWSHYAGQPGGNGEVAFQRQYDHWVSQYVKLGRLPMNNGDKDETRAASWQSATRAVKRGTNLRAKLTVEQTNILTNTAGWEWIGPKG
jgi:hypothetical protein